MTLLWEIRLRLIAPIQEGKLLHITENTHSGTLPARLFCHLAYQQFLSSSWSCLFLTSPGFFFFILSEAFRAGSALSCTGRYSPEQQALHTIEAKPQKLQTSSSKAQIPRRHFPLQTCGCRCSHRYFSGIYLLLIPQVLHPRVLQTSAGSMVSTALPLSGGLSYVRVHMASLRSISAVFN